MGWAGIDRLHVNFVLAQQSSRLVYTSYVIAVRDQGLKNNFIQGLQY